MHAREDQQSERHSLRKSKSTYAGVIDNAQSLIEFYNTMPRGKLGVIFTVPLNGSGPGMTTTEIPWSALKGQADKMFDLSINTSVQRNYTKSS
jgi:hypothetical protein